MGIAHQDGPMRAAVPRKFTLFDALVMIAATGIALVPIRHLLQHGEILLLPEDNDGIPAPVLRTCLEVMVIVSPIVAPWSAALWLLRMRNPRPTLRRVFRQPGTAACSAISLTAIFALVRVIGSLAVWQFLEPTVNWDVVSYIGTADKLALLVIHLSIKFGEMVAVAWIVLWLSGAWRNEASWIDRSGRALGIFCIFTSVLFGWSFAMIWD